MSVAEADSNVPKELVAGKYQLTRLLGRGGMGSVWEGIHTSLGTRVAVKFIESEYVDSAEARHRFENEARAAATLRSKHVVQVYDHGVMPDGRPFIVMEFLGGEPLDKRLDRVGRLTPQETARIVLQVSRALAKAHEAGIVHRDLKPENVFLVFDEDDGSDIVKVVDFGIAKFTDKSLGVSSSTRTGSVLGTPYYMSPEQARGLRSVDYRSDLWSVGVIAYRCVVGRLPFEGEAVGDLLVKICTAPLPVPSQWTPGLTPAFDAWFMRALAREPAERFKTALDLADAMCLACGLPAGRASPASALETGRHVASAASTPYAGQGSWGYGTPGSGVHGVPSADTSAPVHSAPPSPGALTGASFTQTHSPLNRPKRGPIVAAVISGVLVLGIGLALVAKFLSSNAVAEPAAATSTEVPTAPVPSAVQPVEPPPVEP
jgi:eukaryotic-like serine/threonine-protein kinase